MKDVVFLIIMTHGGELSIFTGDKEQEVVMMYDRQTDRHPDHTHKHTNREHNQEHEIAQRWEKCGERNRFNRHFVQVDPVNVRRLFIVVVIVWR